MASIIGILKNKYVRRCARNVCQLSKSESIRDLLAKRPVNSIVTIKGWVTAMRRKKTFIFINVNDGSCSSSIQVVLPNENLPEKLTIGSCVYASGTMDSDLKGNAEVRSDNVNILGGCDIGEKLSLREKNQKKSLKLSRHLLHYRPKLVLFSTTLRLRYASELCVHSYFRDRGFIGVHTPALTSNDCEGAGETFHVTPSNESLLEEMSKEGLTPNEYFFNKKAYLTVSGQFHLEALARGVPKVYTFNQAFRANNSRTRFHLSEFHMVEAEEAFVDDLSDIIKTMEELVKYLIVNITENHKDDLIYILKQKGTDVEKHLELLKRLTVEPFTVMNYSEAKKIIESNRDKIKFLRSSSDDFNKEEELFLVDQNDKIPIFIINWPKVLKPFYAKETKENVDEVQAVDLLAPVVGELCGGSVREDDYEKLKEKLTDLDNLKLLDWYLQLRQSGNVPTGGFGMGFDRFLQFVLNIENIKDVMPFPRWPEHLQL